jgi:hypothetical protein
MSSGQLHAKSRFSPFKAPESEYAIWEALDRTPIVDLKPVLDRGFER